MKKILAIMVGTLLALAVPYKATAAGTVTLTSADIVEGQSVEIYTYTMTADSGDASFPATASAPINGWIIGVETNPGGTAPTDNYDITLLDSDGYDVMEGALANRDTSNTEKVNAPQHYVRGPVTITTTNNAVNSAVVVLAITVLR